MFSLQWIEGPMDEAMVSRTENGGLRIDARQKEKVLLDTDMVEMFDDGVALFAEV